MKYYILIITVSFFFYGECQEVALSINGHKNIVFIKGGSFEMGADNNQSDKDEYPKHKVILNGFWMDITEVTNAQFSDFVNATNYITTAEKKIDWEELKKQLPPNTPKIADKDLQPASLVFNITNQ